MPHFKSSLCYIITSKIEYPLFHIYIYTTCLSYTWAVQGVTDKNMLNIYSSRILHSGHAQLQFVWFISACTLQIVRNICANCEHIIINTLLFLSMQLILNIQKHTACERDNVSNLEKSQRSLLQKLLLPERQSNIV